MNSIIAFDLDGTLIDSVPHIHHAVQSALTELNLPSITMDDTRSFVGHGLPPLLDKVLAHTGSPADRHSELHDRVMHHYTSIPNDPNSVYPGVKAALDTLLYRGFALTVCTNKPGAATQTALQDTGLIDYFQVVIAGDTLATRKPNPEMLFAALKGAKLHAYVGDSEVDSETARQAGVPFALYSKGYRKSAVEDMHHDAVFSDYAELPDILDRLTNATNTPPVT